MFNPPDRRRIYLMRHGEAAYVAADGSITDDPRQVGLTAEGREQAAAQSRALADIAFDRAICSGLPRTEQTARIVLGERTGPNLEVVPSLEEIRGGGPNEDFSDPDYLAHVANPWAAGRDPNATFLGGERFGEFAERVVPAFESIVTQPTWRQLLLVLHGAVNRMIFNHITGLGWRGDLAVEQDNACINVIDVDFDDDGTPHRYLIRMVNLTAYNLSKDGIHLTSMEQTAARVAGLSR